ncbi:unnamed protein product [Cutaneotrichosporon oleaginosum]
MPAVQPMWTLPPRSQLATAPIIQTASGTGIPEASRSPYSGTPNILSNYYTPRKTKTGEGEGRPLPLPQPTKLLGSTVVILLLKLIHEGKIELTF